MSFTVPADVDIWGKENVIIRMIPSSKKSDDGSSYEGSTKINTNVECSINYFAVRCNKR